MPSTVILTRNTTVHNKTKIDLRSSKTGSSKTESKKIGDKANGSNSN